MVDKSTDGNIPPGFTLHYILRGHTDLINRIAWSPDGRILASPSDDKTIRLWDPETGQLLNTLLGHSRNVNSVAWSPDGRILASGSDDETIRLWDPETSQALQTLRGHSDWVQSIAWSPDGRILASGSSDRSVRLWDPETSQALQTLRGHSDRVRSVAWSPDGRVLSSSSDDYTIRLWNSITGQQTNILEGHTDAVIRISFSYDNRLLVSKSYDETVRLWRCDTWKMVTILNEPSTMAGKWSASLAFHPKAPVLATTGEENKVLRIWNLDFTAILGTPSATPSIHYTNAKVVLVGDSGVGKSGLGHVLSGQSFVPTESTHGRNVWLFDNQEVELSRKVRETRETWLWDLAGQPGYRLIHQLYLNEVTLALLVFDSRNETDPFAGIHYWIRALKLAERIQYDSAPPMKKFLVAARIDRGGIAVSRERIDALVQEWGLDGYFETSAKEGQNIVVLVEAIKGAIDWEKLPKVTSTELFQRIKAFLVAEKEAGHLLSTRDDLYRAFLKSEKDLDEARNLDAQFETCIGLVESQAMIRRLSFGNLVLLQPELLDAYASALVNAVRDEPDGLGSILEEKVRVCGFPMPKDERIQNKELEKLLLIAMVEDLLRYEIALREQGDDGTYLVFPSQSTRENPDLPDPEGKAIVFRFEGSVLNIYTTLAVRLSHSSLFRRKELWKNAVIYTTKMGGVYGIFLRNIGEGRGELTLFFDKAARGELSFHFEEFVYVHL